MDLPETLNVDSAPPSALLEPAVEAAADTPSAPVVVRRPPPLVPEQLVAATLAAAGMALADGLRAVTRSDLAQVTFVEQLGAFAALIALYLPLALGLALATSLLVAVARATPWLTGLRRRLAHPSGWLDADPEAFASTFGALAGLGAAALVARSSYIILVTRTHRIDLAGWSMGGITVGIIVGAVAVAALVRVLLRRPARWLGPFASVLGLLTMAAAVAVAVGAYLLLSYPAVVQTYGLARLLWGPAAAILFLVALGPVRRRLAPIAPRRLWLGTVGLLAAIAVSWAGVGLGYRASNRVRAMVEQHSILGRPLVRQYANATDLDGDGHAWAFGGRDCDDFDASVYPGAQDPEGDGVDSDCFAGDGSPDVADFSDGHYGARPSGLPARPNVLLFTIDALRPDHLGVNGYRRPVSPNIDEFAEDAVVFDDVLAQSARSIRSIPSLLTGRYPSQIAFGPEYLYPSFLRENETLPEVLAENGYETAAVMGTTYFQRVGTFFQGFDRVRQMEEYKPPRERTVDLALEQLEELAEGDEPFFQWVHLFNVHEPYLRPRLASRFGPRSVDGYDTEIVIADEQFQRVLDALDEMELSDSTVVILASDHGEAFGERGRFGHSSDLYQEQVAATLMVRVPGTPARRVVGPVALMDLFPTVLNLADIPVPNETPSRSLVPQLTGERPLDEDRILFAELMPDGMFPFDVKMLRQGARKLQWWVQDGSFHLFDLGTDPEERFDRSDEHRDEALALLGLLQAWVAETNRPENRNEDFVRRNTLPAPPRNMTHPLDVSVPGVFTVLGFDMPRSTFRPNDRIPLTFYYRVDGETDMNLFIRASVEGPHGYVVPPDFHAHHFPLRGRYPTTQWRRGQIIRDSVPMVVPPNITTPAQLALTLSVEQRGRGLIDLEQGGRAISKVSLTTFRVLGSRGRRGAATEPTPAPESATGTQPEPDVLSPLRPLPSAPALPTAAPRWNEERPTDEP